MLEQFLFPDAARFCYVITDRNQPDLQNYHGLHPLEQALVSHSVDVRKAEFGDARWCAHQALRDLGHCDYEPILRGERGMPLWPDSVTGSMTHTEGFRAAVVAPKKHVRSMGLDAEPAEALPREVISSIARPGEIPQLERLRSEGIECADRLLFCYDTKSAQPLSDIPPALHTYLAGHTSALHSRVDWHPIPSPWHLQRVRPSSLGHRVAWRDIAPELCAAPLLPVHQGGPLLLNTAYYVAAPSHQLAIRWTCWLNSPPIRTLARNSAQQALHGYFRFLAHTVGALPFPFFLFDPEPIDDLDRLANELATQPAAYPDLSAELARTVTELLAAERAFLADRGLSLCPAT